MMKFRLLSMLFNRTDFKSRVSNMTEKDLVAAFETAVEGQKFELAAYLKYYLDFKYKKSVCDLV